MAAEEQKVTIELLVSEVDFIASVVQHTTYSGDLAAMQKLVALGAAVLSKLDRARGKNR